MAECDECGADENMPYQCRHCGGTFCGDHRLPENHDCPGLGEWNDPDGVFASDFDDSVATGGGTSSEGLLDALPIDTGRGSALGYFRGNMTYVFLALMWITYGLQYIVFPVAGYPVYSATWNAAFTLVPENAAFAWTWVTSIFSHAPGLFHIAGNSIIIFFFGRLVEDYVGSRDFTLLFFGSGVVAGLGQAAIPFLLGGPTDIPILGASGAGLAIMGVLTILRPDLKVYVYFILPVPIWAITGFYALLSVGGIFGFGLGGVANGAHLVGLLIGLWYGRRVKGNIRMPNNVRFGGGGPGGPGGGPGGPGGGRRGPF